MKIHNNKLHVVVEQNSEDDEIQSVSNCTDKDRFEKLTQYSNDTRASSELNLDAQRFLLQALSSP